LLFAPALLIAKAMFKPLRRLYNWTLHIASHKHAAWWLAGISFAESSFFPIPPDIALMPMCIATREKSLRYANICTASSVIGGLFGYAIGYFLFESIGRKILAFYGLNHEFDVFSAKFNTWGAWIVFISGCAPIPYKVITIASGVTKLNLFTFTLASFAGRGFRFYLLSALLWKYGKPIQDFIEKYLELLTLLFLTLLIGGFIALKYLL
jgi:membrane protein YqaA with SNARE-associated domain